MEYKTIKLKRLYGNVASVRDYAWEKCVDKNQGIIFVCNGAEMKVEPHEVRAATPGKTKFTSKYDGKKYRLVDFQWKAGTNIGMFGGE